VSYDEPLAEYEIGSGALRGSRLTLFRTRLVHQGGEWMEVVPLAQLASVRIAFERDLRKLNWALALLIVALILGFSSAPLQSWIASLAAGVREHAGRESLDGALVATLGALGGLARLLVPLAVVAAGAAAALLAFFWLGSTSLTLCFAATERAYPVRGRDPYLTQFAQTVAAQLPASRSGQAG